VKRFSTAASMLGFVLLAAGWGSCAYAVELGESVELHGYGHLGFLKTDANRYLKADTVGTWQYRDLALLFTGKLHDRSKAWAQLYGSDGKVRLDWAFLDYQLASGPTLQFGQIKLPLGIYNETRDVEFIRPSSMRPFLYQDAAEISDEAYRGLGLLYDHDLGGGSMSWNVYAGRIVEFEEDHPHIHKRLVGARAVYRTPVEGLSVMASAYDSEIEMKESGEAGHKRVAVLSLDHFRGDLDLKAEYARKTAFGEVAETWYAQAAYTFNDKWTPYVRYDYVTTDRANRADPSFYQRATVLGLGYKISSNVGLRLETHINHGYALPVASEEVEAGAGETDWTMTAFSLSFFF
jgi:hypothetical protein